ncbi:MAG: hypothetical protein U9N42_01470, partial [Campylobacterota bacterium]|nr:hypothetical protein [Campylobacterota bacterium]
MKYIITSLLLLVQLHSASIDENYFDNEKAHKYIESKREKLNKVNSEDIEVINKITFQNLLLTKLSKLLNSPTDAKLPNIDNIEEESVDEKMFIFYFNKLSEYYIDLENLKIKKDKSLEIINNIKERLSNLAAENRGEIEISQMEYAYYKYKFEDIKSLIKQYKKFNEKAIEKLSLIVNKTPFNKEEIDAKIVKLSEVVEKNRKRATTLKLYTERSLINLLRDVKKSELGMIDDIKLSDDVLNSPKAATYKANLKNLKNATNELVISINKKLNYIILAQFYNFEQDDMEAYKELDAVIKRDSAELDEQSLRQLREKEKILDWFISKYLGYIGAIFYDTSLWVDKFLDSTSEITSKTLYISNDKSVTLVDIFWMIVIIIVGFFVGNL